MKRLSWLVVPFVLGVFAACGGGQETSDGPKVSPDNPETPPVVEPTVGEVPEDVPDDGPAWLQGERPENLPEDTFVVGVAVAASAEEAQAAAETALATALWGTDVPPWEDLPPVFEKGTDPMLRETLSDDRVAVLAALERKIAAERIQAWVDNPPAADATDANTPWGALSAALYLHDLRGRQAFACTRRQALIETDCEPPDVEAAKKSIRDIGDRVQVVSSYHGGVPYRPGDKPLRPLSVRVVWTSPNEEEVPWGGLKLTIDGDAAAQPQPADGGEPAADAPKPTLATTTLTTDKEGRAEVDFLQIPAPNVEYTVHVDRAALLGELATLWGERKLDVGLRDLSAAKLRVGIALHESVAADSQGESEAAKRAATELGKLGHESPQVLDGEWVDLAKKPNSKKMMGLADETGGKVDLVVLGEAHSEFVSRMGSRSVWHEAIVQARVYDVWTGAEVAKVEQVAKQSGIGDRNAATKALRAVGERLAEAVHQALKGSASIASRTAQR